VDTLLSGVGACRDFAHLTIALCRALGVPARLASVYAPGLSPMDFHAVVETRRGTSWEVLDPTRLAPRASLTRIATGRDAADTAFATTLCGQTDISSIEITTVVDGDLPADDHVAPLSLA
jgi:Transglutaminase-like enzymes, putative cysteine proteases